MNKRSLSCLLLTVALLFSLPFIVLADGSITTGSISADEMNALSGKSIEKLAYGSAPDHIYPFVYKGYEWAAEILNIDTSACVSGKLYIFDKDTEELTQLQIGDEMLEGYASSKDHLYCITVDGRIIQTDYSGSFFEHVYTSAENDIYRPVVFGEYLVFIEGGNSVTIINTMTKETERVLSSRAITSIFMFDDDKIIWRDEDGIPSYYNLTSRENTVLGNEHKVNRFIAPYVSSETNTGEPVYSTYSLINLDPNTNDVSFPLPEYPAVPGTGFIPDTVLSYFTDNYAGSNQCDGFAKYAHDRFLHIENWSRSGPSWVANAQTNPDYHENVQFTTIESMKSFFASLTKGAFVRYVSHDDLTPSNGTHSIVFDRVDASGEGIWVYECNQDGECGVGYQKYQFTDIFGHYISVLYYVDHDFSTQKVFENASYHKYDCVNCGGYLRQAHTSRQSVIATKNTHTTSYSCCGGSQVLSHTAARQTAVNSTLNHRIYYSCCSGYVTESHSYSSGTCTVCGYTRGGSVVEPVGVGLECERI